MGCTTAADGAVTCILGVAPDPSSHSSLPGLTLLAAIFIVGIGLLIIAHRIDTREHAMSMEIGTKVRTVITFDDVPVGLGGVVTQTHPDTTGYVRVQFPENAWEADPNTFLPWVPAWSALFLPKELEVIE